MTIVSKIVYPNLESLAGDFLPQLRRNPIASFGNKIKGGAESKIQFHFHQGPAVSDACLAFDIVRENYGELFAFRPAWPVFRWTLRSWHDRPNIPNALA
jgi:hypothetical protein